MDPDTHKIQTFQTMHFTRTLRATTGLLASVLLLLATACSNNDDNATNPGNGGNDDNPPVETVEPVTLTIDFAQGPGIATPALPASSDEAVNGRHEYTIAGYTLAVYADPEFGGKIFWNDQTQYYDAPEPNKALYFFSKEGAYVEFPAIEGLALTQIEYVSMAGAGATPDFDLTDTEGQSLDHALDFADDGLGMTFTPLTPAKNTACRITILNHKNAQVARLTLRYTVPE